MSWKSFREAWRGCRLLTEMCVKPSHNTSFHSDIIFVLVSSLRHTVWSLMKENKNRRKKDVVSYQQLLKWLHRACGGGKEGDLKRESQKENKGKK